MLQTNITQYKYTPDEMNEDEFLKKFAARNGIFETIFSDIQRTDYTTPAQNIIIVGQRGQGKSTLLRKIQLEVARDKELSKILIPIKFAEEQYQVRSLCRLWELVAEKLEDISGSNYKGLLDEMEQRIDDDGYDMDCFEYLNSAIKKQDKKLILFIDNFDELLGKLKDQEQRRLREILIESASVQIIGGSTKMLEQNYNHNNPFYSFFKIIPLRGLNSTETVEFLKAVTPESQKEKIIQIIESQAQKIETIRQLTGGVPRTLMIMLDILMSDNASTLDALVKILDESTPLYKHRMDDLPPPLQDIVHAIALNWDGMMTKDIAKKTRMSSKEASSQLKQLERYQIVESVSAGAKNKIYKIQERFFNIWYLMRFGRKNDRQKVEWLVRFLNAWYSKEELEDKARSFAYGLRGDASSPFSKYLMCEALAKTAISISVEAMLKSTTREHLRASGSELADILSSSDMDIANKAFEVRDTDNHEAIKLLLSMNKRDVLSSYVLGVHYVTIAEHDKAEKYLLEVIHSNEEYKEIGGMKKDALALILLYSLMNGKFDIAENYIEQYISYKEEHDIPSFLLAGLGSAINIKCFFCKYYEAVSLMRRLLDASPENNDMLDSGMTMWLKILLLNKQTYLVKNLFEDTKYNLKDKYKPIWYALVSLMPDEFPYELQKMGGELQESVNSILAEINGVSL